MLEFMEYIQLAFAEGTRWNQDNSYSSLTATADCMFDTKDPRNESFANSFPKRFLNSTSLNGYRFICRRSPHPISQLRIRLEQSG